MNRFATRDLRPGAAVGTTVAGHCLGMKIGIARGVW